MQDVELFVHMAEIAGVFVGFGALIAVRSGGPSDIYDVTYIGMVVWFGILVVLAALAPIAISRFDVPTRLLWPTCSAMALALFFVGDEVVSRVWSERRAYMAANPLRRRWRSELLAAIFWVPMTVALVLVMLGVPAGREEALYLAALILLLMLDATLLLFTVLAVGRPARRT